jgi:hypothetical protein
MSASASSLLRHAEILSGRPPPTQGCEMLGIPHCLDRLTDGGKVVKPYAPAALYSANIILLLLVLILLEAEGLAQPEGFGKLKKIHSSGSEPATFRLSALGTPLPRTPNNVPLQAGPITAETCLLWR